MEQISLTAAILTANIIAGWFFWGCYRARNLWPEDGIDRTTFFALVIPLLFVMAGHYLSI